MKLTSSGLTHVGMKRSHNEDCLRIYRDEHLFIVADGMGDLIYLFLLGFSPYLFQLIAAFLL